MLDGLRLRACVPERFPYLTVALCEDEGCATQDEPCAFSQALFTSKYGKEYAQEVINHKEKYLDLRLLKILTRRALALARCTPCATLLPRIATHAARHPRCCLHSQPLQSILLCHRQRLRRSPVAQIHTPHALRLTSPIAWQHASARPVSRHTLSH